jgi:UDP-N-acetylglucosamine--N-acetylmuramyl-(pentapeptide) pyrophosphoryl-undecaprenol N-acetylglucosamine transferase
VRTLKKIPRREAATALGLELREGDIVAGVLGGSLGSAPLETLAERLSGATSRNVPESKKNKGNRLVFVVLGSAPESSGSETRGAAVHFVGRRWDMTPFYSLCDVALCRAGASTLAELEAYGIPALVIPWTKAADGHQEANALNFLRRTGNENALWAEDDADGLDEALRGLLERRASRNIPVFNIPVFEDTASPALWGLRPRTPLPASRGRPFSSFR